MVVVCLTLALAGAPARAGPAAGTTYVDGISDQSLPAWDGNFSQSYFGPLFSAVWVTAGHIRLARYVVPWTAVGEPTNGADPQGDYHEKLEAWLADVARLGLVPEVALTSYDGVYPQTLGEYEASLRVVLDRATAMGDPVRYVEAWNEPNNQGHQRPGRAAELTNSAEALCRRGYGCTVVAGDLEDSPDVAGYEAEYERGLDFTPTIWGVHPYYSVERESEAPLENFIENLPRRGAGQQIFFTEIAARTCTDYHGHLIERGELGQADRARWLVDTLMRNQRPEHVFYYAFLLSERRQPGCSPEPEDGALYRPSTAAAAPDVPRPAASYVWGGQAGALAAGCTEPLAFPRGPGGEPAIAWSPPVEPVTQWSLPVLADGCMTRAGPSTPTFIP